MSILKYSVGIDMSKSDFKANLSTIDTAQKVTVKASRTFTNNSRGFQQFIEWVLKNYRETSVPLHFLMEATGIYHEHLALFLYKGDYRVSIILPTKAKRYLQSLGHKSKNDKIDAQGLARMGAEQSLACWKPVSSKIYTLRALTRTHEDLQVQRTSIISRLKSSEYGMYETPKVDKVNQNLLKVIQGELKNIENEISKIIRKDKLLNEKYHLLDTIKGIGLMTFAVVVSETNGFTLFSNSRQLTSYAGYDIVENQSGKRTGKTRISKKGNAHIRRILNMPAFNVVKYEPYFAAFYERIYSNTGLKKKAYTAVQRKLLCLMYCLWNKNEPFKSLQIQKEILLEVNG